MPHTCNNMDDMITTSKQKEDHVNLKKVDIKYQLRLNPTKCTFNIRSEKLLGFVINSDEIKVDLNNIKVIQAMTAQSTKREV